MEHQQPPNNPRLRPGNLALHAGIISVLLLAFAADRCASVLGAEQHIHATGTIHCAIIPGGANDDDVVVPSSRKNESPKLMPPHLMKTFSENKKKVVENDNAARSSTQPPPPATIHKKHEAQHPEEVC